jgi:transposase-like protein
MAHPVRHNSTLSTPQLQIVALLASGVSVSAAAAQAGVHRSTVHNWRLRDPLFARELDRARECHAAEVRSQMESLASQALETLHSILTGPNTSDSVRLKAALAVLQAVPAVPQSEADPAAPEFPLETARNEATFSALRPVDSPTESSIPRSAPCPCGSGLKYKRCCGQSAPPQLRLGAPAA